MGDQGVGLHMDGDYELIPAFTAPDIHDTPCVGDAFVAGLAAGYLPGLEWREAARFGCAVAALKIGHPGAREGLPTSGTATKFLAAATE